MRPNTIPVHGFRFRGIPLSGLGAVGYGGTIDNVRYEAGMLHVSGWAGDADGRLPTAVAVFVDDQLAGYADLATIERSDVAQARQVPGWEYSGWSFSVSASRFGPGQHTVSAMATGHGGGTWNLPGEVPLSFTVPPEDIAPLEAAASVAPASSASLSLSNLTWWEWGLIGLGGFLLLRNLR